MIKLKKRRKIMFGTTFNFNEVMKISSFVCNNIHQDTEHEDPNSYLWTTFENKTGVIGGHMIPKASPLQNVLNGVYKFEIQDPLFPQTRHCYIGKSRDISKGIEARITQEVWRLRGYPERGQIINILQMVLIIQRTRVLQLLVIHKHLQIKL